MSGNLEHILHASILGILLYFIMTLFLGQNPDKACGRSIILASISLIPALIIARPVASLSDPNDNPSTLVLHPQTLVNILATSIPINKATTHITI